MAGNPRYIAQQALRTVSANFTRPNNTTAYSAGQVMANSTSSPLPLNFQLPLEDSGMATIRAALCIDEANQGTKPDLELWLFDTAPTATNDGQAVQWVAADLEALVGVIKFPVANFQVGNAGSGASGQCICQTVGDVQVKATSTSRTIYGVLVVRNAYTPVANEKFVIKLKVQD